MGEVDLDIPVYADILRAVREEEREGSGVEFRRLTRALRRLFGGNLDGVMWRIGLLVKHGYLSREWPEGGEAARVRLWLTRKGAEALERREVSEGRRTLAGVRRGGPRALRALLPGGGE